MLSEEQDVEMQDMEDDEEKREPLLFDEEDETQLIPEEYKENELEGDEEDEENEGTTRKGRIFQTVSNRLASIVVGKSFSSEEELNRAKEETRRILERIGLDERVNYYFWFLGHPGRWPQIANYPRD